MAQKNRIKAINLNAFNSSVLSGTYQAINGSGTTHPLVYLKVINNSNVDVTISYDGVDDHDFIPADSTLPLVPPQYKTANTDPAFAQGTIIYAKGSSGTGNVYVAGYYLE